MPPPQSCKDLLHKILTILGEEVDWRGKYMAEVLNLERSSWLFLFYKLLFERNKSLIACRIQRQLFQSVVVYKHRPRRVFFGCVLNFLHHFFIESPAHFFFFLPSYKLERPGACSACQQMVHSFFSPQKLISRHLVAEFVAYLSSPFVWCRVLASAKSSNSFCLKPPFKFAIYLTFTVPG